MSLVCGVDSSTQSTKVELRDLQSGALVATARAPHPATAPPRSEQDPASWWDALTQALADVSAHLGDVAAISIAGQQHGLVVLGEDDRVLRPAKLWNDTESAPQAERLTASIGAGEWAARAGSVPVAAITISKLAWLADNEPDTLAATRRVMLPHDWLTFRLSGSHVTDRGDASGSGWWSPASGDVDTGLLGLVDGARDWRSMTPEVLGPHDRAGAVTPEAAAATGLSAGCVVAPGTGDNMGAALGLGLARGDVVVSLGTSGTVYAVSDRPTGDASGAVAGFADATGRFLPLVCTLNATKVTDAFARLLGCDQSTFVDLALSSTAGADGLTLVPYLDGERTPNRPEATGVLAGMRGDLDRASVARAAHEGVVCGLLDGMTALEHAGVALDGRLFLVGGGARSAAYRRIVADLTQRAVRVPHEDEVVATGACVQAAMVLGEASCDAIAKRWGLGAGEETEPDPAIDAQGLRQRYASMVAQVDGL